MKTIFLISCVKTKLDHKARVQDIYVSPWFRKALAYARTSKPDDIYVLSAKYGLLSLSEEIAPYQMTLIEMSKREIKIWSGGVIKKLASVSNLEQDRFVILAGENYRSYLIPHITNFEIPMEGLAFGEQLQFLKDQA